MKQSDCGAREATCVLPQPKTTKTTQRTYGTGNVDGLIANRTKTLRMHGGTDDKRKPDTRTFKNDVRPVKSEHK